MKKTIKINLSGFIFNLDDDAYDKLNAYLETIINHFRDREGGKEIVEDIESRIAEIFQEMTGEKKEVITLEDVNEVIRIMGEPEELINEDDFEEDQKRVYYTTRERKRLYRDPDNAIFGGVCGGLGAYMNIDPVVFRVLFVILTLATGLFGLLYIILWITVPKAETAAQKLEMRGERVTISNIEKTIKEEYKNVKKSFAKARESKEFQKTRNVLDEIFQVLGKIIVVSIKVLLIIIGFGLIIGAVTALMGITGVFFFGPGMFDTGFLSPGYLSLQDFLSFFLDPATASLFLFSLLLALAIPLVALIYGIIRLTFRFRANDRVLGLIALVLWILSVVFISFVAINEGMNYRQSARFSSARDLDGFTGDTLVVLINQPEVAEENFSAWIFSYQDEQFFFADIENGKIYAKIQLDIEESLWKKYKLQLENRAWGRSYTDAGKAARRIDYNWSLEGNKLLLDPYFTQDRLSVHRQELDVTVFVPEGKYIYLDEQTRYLLEGVESAEDLWESELAGHTWVMSEDGLK